MTEKTFHGLTAADLQSMIDGYQAELRQILPNNAQASRVSEILSLLDRLKTMRAELDKMRWMENLPKKYGVLSTVEDAS